MKTSSDFSKGSLGSAKGKAADSCSKSLGSSTQGAHDASVPATGEMSKVASVADAKGKTDSMGKPTGAAPKAAPTGMDTVRRVADGK